MMIKLLFLTMLSVLVTSAFSSEPNVDKINKLTPAQACEEGIKCLQSNSVEHNLNIAFKYFENAAERSYPEAQYRLAVMYQHGIFVAMDRTLAIKWYTAAAMNDYTDAKALLYRLCRLKSGPRAANFVPFSLLDQDVSTFEVMMSDLGISDGANTSPRNQLQKIVDCKLRDSFSMIFQDFQVVKNHIENFNSPGFIINCLKFKNVSLNNNHQSTFIRHLNFKNKNYICFGESNVKDFDILSQTLLDLNVALTDVLSKVKFIIENHPEKNTEYFDESVSYLSQIHSHTTKLLEAVVNQIDTGLPGRNKYFIDHYRKAFGY